MDTDRLNDRMARRADRWHGRSGVSGLLFGGLVVAVGLLMLLDNLDIVHFHDLWRFWPVAVIIMGVAKVLEARSPVGYVVGGMVALVGAFLLLDNLNVVPFNFDLIWPLVIIAFGITVLLRALERKKILAAAPGISNPDVSLWAVFSGVKRKVDSQDFKGGDVVAVFGGVNIDLRNAAIAGERAVIDLNLLFGGVDIRVPENWNVVMKGVAIFGAFEDKTTHPRTDPNGKTPELVITGTAMFAGVNAKN
jgi:predicted membrane protein